MKAITAAALGLMVLAGSAPAQVPAEPQSRFVVTTDHGQATICERRSWEADAWRAQLAKYGLTDPGPDLCPRSSTSAE
ncbi:MAG TPA: hypothetical protein VNW90_10645 [Acetobacteraceae bacterium]|nr:hypothetical protein [Acetobacteraceae bacterium]